MALKLAIKRKKFSQNGTLDQHCISPVIPDSLVDSRVLANQEWVGTVPQGLSLMTLPTETPFGPF